MDCYVPQAVLQMHDPCLTSSASHAGAEDVDADDVEGGEADVEGGELAPHSQVILTGCWLTMKEISLLLGIVATCAPLPGVCACVRLSLCVCQCV